MDWDSEGGYAWALANPGIRVDWDSVDFHGIHGTAKIWPYSVISMGTGIRVDWDSVDFHGIHGTANTDSDWVDMRGHWQTLDSVDFDGIHMALSPTGWICMGIGKPWPYKGRLG